MNTYIQVYVQTAQVSYVVNFIKHAQPRQIVVQTDGVSFQLPENKWSLIKQLQKKGFAVTATGKRKISWWQKLMLRIGVWVGLLASFGIVFGLTQYTWRVEYVCAENLNQNQKLQLQQVLQNYGVVVGAKRHTQNKQHIEHAVITGVEGVAYCEIEYQGMVTNVHLVLETKPQEQTGKDIVASQTGLILEMCVTSGTALVKTGDVVQKGQVLVKGDTASGKNAEASIRALVQISGNVTYNEQSVTYVRTGRVVEQQMYYLGNYALTKPNQTQPFTFVEKVEKNVYLFPNLLAPILKKSILYYELKEEKVAPFAEQEPLLQQQALQNAKQALPKGIKPTKISYYTQMRENLHVVVAVLQFEQNIATYTI